MSDNNIRIYGNLTREPELRFTQGGTAVCNFGVAVNRRFMQNNEWVDAPTNFFNVTVWNQLGENCAATLNKGDRVFVEGRLDFREYEKDGVTHKTHDLIADEVCPSLKWATASMVRTTKSNGAPAPDRQGGGQASRQPSGGSGSYGGRPADPIYGDEEPF